MHAMLQFLLSKMYTRIQSSGNSLRDKRANGFLFRPPEPRGASAGPREPLSSHTVPWPTPLGYMQVDRQMPLFNDTLRHNVRSRPLVEGSAAYFYPKIFKSSCQWGNHKQSPLSGLQRRLSIRRRERRGDTGLP